MRATTLDDVLVYKKSLEGADAVSALLERPAFRKDFELKDQLSRASSRTAALIAQGRQYISEEERLPIAGIYIEIVKMLTSWINYLDRSGWKKRS